MDYGLLFSYCHAFHFNQSRSASRREWDKDKYHNERAPEGWWIETFFFLMFYPLHCLSIEWLKLLNHI